MDGGAVGGQGEPEKVKPFEFASPHRPVVPVFTLIAVANLFDSSYDCVLSNPTWFSLASANISDGQRLISRECGSG